MFKRLVRSPTVLAGFGVVLWVYMVLLARTLRWRFEGVEHAEHLWRQPGPFVLAAWHSRLLIMPMIQIKLRERWPARPHRMALMVSASRDGDITQQACRMMGLHIIRASAAKKNSKKDKRGFQGAREALSVMSQGACVCMTMDGPRGPAEIAVVGGVKLAQQMGAPILIYATSAKGARLKTWDRMIFPLPFARGAVVFHPPIPTSKDMDSEALRQEVERQLKAATARADLLAGRAPEDLPLMDVGARAGLAAPATDQALEQGNG